MLDAMYQMYSLTVSRENQQCSPWISSAQKVNMFSVEQLSLLMKLSLLVDHFFGQVSEPQQKLETKKDETEEVSKII